jgi:hypothetical protein
VDWVTCSSEFLRQMMVILMEPESHVRTIVSVGILVCFLMSLTH